MGIRQKGLEIIAATKPLIVNTAGLDGYPNTRIFYSHASDGYTVYFSTGAHAEKVREIAKNPKVSAYYENTAQEIAGWKNVVVYGDARALEPETDEYKKAVRLIGEKSPAFKKRAQENQLGESILYRIAPRRVKVLDFAADPRVEVFEVDPQTDW